MGGKEGNGGREGGKEDAPGSVAPDLEQDDVAQSGDNGQPATWRRKEGGMEGEGRRKGWERGDAFHCK